MIRGLYAAYTGLEAAWRYQEALADNIANATTVGFKRQVGALASFEDVLLAQQEPVPAPLPARIQQIVGQIGTGTFVAELTTDLAIGPFQHTGEELDLALERGFFAVEGPDGTRYYTKAGHFQRDGEGRLVTPHGYFVLGADGLPLTLPATRVAVEPDGRIVADGNEVGRLLLLDFPPEALTRAGPAYFTADGEGIPVDSGLRQGYLELSNTQLTEELTTLLAVHRAYQANQRILATLDTTLERAAGELGRLGG